MRRHTLEFDAAQAKLSAETEAEHWSCVVGCTGAIFAFGSIILLFLVSTRVAYKIMERLLLSAIYGSTTYHDGLRFVGKHGRLTDGSVVSDWLWAIFVFGQFLIFAPVMFAYVAFLQRVGLLRNSHERGGRLPLL